MKRRQRITEIIVKQSAEICSILPNADGTLSLVDSEGNLVEHEQHQAVGYLRECGKPKILRSIVRTTNDHFGDNPWKKYDKLGFIDTNSKDDAGQHFFVSSSSFLLWQNGDRRFGNIHRNDLLIGLCSADFNPERVAWCDFIYRMQASNLLSATDKMLLVVDSEKSLIASINERTEPVFSDFFLPDGFSIAYATSDAGAESWINKEMRRRDRVSIG